MCKILHNMTVEMVENGLVMDDICDDIILDP